MKRSLPAMARTVLTITVGVVACSSDPAGVSDTGFQAAKGGPGGGAPSVQAANPAYGHQGDLGLSVTITGSGFDEGSTAAWERNGVPDPEIVVLSTQFISSTQLSAVIDITGSADLAFYDIAVTTRGGRKGIGTEMFEVTQATPIMGTGLIRGVNENGEMTGQGPIFWSPAGGLEIVGSGGSGWDLSDDGLTIVGGNTPDGSPASNSAVIWTRTGSAWVESLLPRDPAATAGNAVAVASDATTGAATAIGGVDTYIPKRNTIRREPRLWLRDGSTWQRVLLPGPTGFVNDLSSNLVAVGYVATGAAVWEPNGTGGWQLTVIGPSSSVGPTSTEAKAVNRAGTIVVGTLNQAAVYWQQVGGVWSNGIPLPGGCPRATGIDDLGRILLSGCPLDGGFRQVNAAVIVPPYAASDIIVLGGFGDREDGPQVWAISRLGTWIVGSAKLKNSVIGAYWNVF
jgi:hypothetical protein